MNINEIEQEISELEARLEDLYRQKNEWNSKVNGKESGWNIGACFEVSGSSDSEVNRKLALSSLPELAFQILEAIPVQVFIKHTEFIEGKGRKYTYMNKEARKSLRWSLREVKTSKYDSDAFWGGYNSVLYKRMVSQENETIKKQRSRETKLDWTPGEHWHHNSTIEVPIEDKLGKVVGFCAIAQDIEFRDFKKTYTSLGHMYKHEYNSLNSGVRQYLNNILIYIKNEENNKIPTEVDKMSRHLTTAAKEVDAMYEALNVNNPESQISAMETGNSSVKTVIKEIESIYNFAHFNLKLMCDEELGDRAVFNRLAVVGILTSFISNAVNHSPKEKTDVELKCFGTSDEVFFEVSNLTQGPFDIDNVREKLHKNSGSCKKGLEIIHAIAAKSLLGIKPDKTLDVEFNKLTNSNNLYEVKFRLRCPNVVRDMGI